MSIWTKDMIERLRALAKERSKSAAGLAEALSSEFGLPITRGMVCGKADREGIALRSQSEAEKGKRRKPAAGKAPAPALSPVDPPFLPPVPLVREYVPTGRSPVTFLASGDFVCKAFLPGEPLTHAGLVCGNPVPEGRARRFCDACNETLNERVKVATRCKLAMPGKRKAAA